jgi:hypothetical protein
MLIEFHVIQDHGPSNMNRDQNGRPKTAFYAGTQRLRVSSQCRKRTLRQPRPADRPEIEPGVFEKTVGSSHFGVRTRLLPEKVAEKWRQLHGDDAPFLDGIKAAVSGVAKGDGKQEETRADGLVRTPQAIYLELDREVDRVIAVLNELHAANQLELLADESQVFADNLDDAAKKIGWDKKEPSKLIAWESVKKGWQSLSEAIEALDVAQRPRVFDAKVAQDDLVPGYDLAEGLLRVIQIVEAEDAGKAKELMNALAYPRGKKPKSAAKISLAERLKLTAKRTVSAADIALFGRMTTSDAFRDVEAACQVADSITTHPVDIEDDYFTTGDDLDTVAALPPTQQEMSSGVFYHYLAVDYDALLRNLGACIPKGKENDEKVKSLAQEANETAERSVEGLLRAVMQNVPSGKINSHAHNQQPSLILVEIKNEHVATNYLTAFHEPARAGQREDGSVETLLTDSVRKLLAFARYRDRKMAIDGKKSFLFENDEPTEQAVKRLCEEVNATRTGTDGDSKLFENSEVATCDTFKDFVDKVIAAVREGIKK